MNSPENPRSRSGVAGLALEARNVVAGTICLPLKIGRCQLRKCGDYKVPKAAFCDDRLNLARVIDCTPAPTCVRHALVIKAAGHSAVSWLPPGKTPSARLALPLPQAGRPNAVPLRQALAPLPCVTRSRLRSSSQSMIPQACQH